MEKIGKLTIPRIIVLILILAPFVFNDWHWGYSVIGAIILGVAVVALHAIEDRFL